MTLADRIADVLLERGPLPGCEIGAAVRKRKAEVIEALHSNRDRFVRVGEARASRWHLVPQGYAVEELAARWGKDAEMGHAFVCDFLAAGYLERVDGNGRVVVTDQGVAAAAAVEGLNPEALA